MTSKVLKSEALLLLTAAIWGFAFVAQRIGMEHVGPFIFNGVRFALGGLFLLPFLITSRRRLAPPQSSPERDEVALSERRPRKHEPKRVLLFSCLTGLILFFGASLQQIGIVYTTAGKAGFITGLYVIVVPILGLFWKQHPGSWTWLGAASAVAGLYLLSFSGRVTVSKGDLIVLSGAFFWAGHVLMIGWLTSWINGITLAFIQFITCSVLSLLTAFVIETVALQGLLDAAVPILYGGLLSVGIAYTLQVIAQRHAQPAHTAIIISMETVFAALGGWLILDETLPLRGIAGCALMLIGILLSRLGTISKQPSPAVEP